jgi:flagellar biosynthesis protein FlhB
VYPLKFLFSLLISSWSGLDLFSRANEQGLVVLNKDEFPQLVILFSIGYFLIWFIIYLLHRRVLHFATRFDFTRYELFFTKKEARGAFWNALIGLAALLLAFIHLPVLAGVCYLFIPVVLIYNQHIFKRQCKKQGKLK